MSNKILDILQFNNQLVTESMKLNKPVPLDCRFIVSNINNLDKEIPKQYRYPGLIFFVPDTQLTVGTSSNKIVGIYYCFENDLNTAVPLHDLSLRYIVHQLSGIDDLTTIINRLNNDTYSKPGNIVDLKDIGIQVIFNGTKWRYFNGKYILKSLDDWNKIPDDIKQPNTIVEVKPNIRKVVTSLLQLSDEIIETNLDNLTENNRYYLVDGFLYYRLNNTNYQLSNRMFILHNFTLSENIEDYDDIYYDENNYEEDDITATVIEHNLYCDYVSVKIYTEVNYNGKNGKFAKKVDAEVIQLGLNRILIKSCLKCKCDILIEANSNV